MDTHTVLFAFGLTLFAGLATGIGSAAAFFAKTTNTKLLSVSLGFSAGVMIYISFVELFSEAKHVLISELGEAKGNLIAVSAFFGGIFVIALIDKLVPDAENPHEVHKIEEMGEQVQVDKNKKLLRMGLLAALAIAIHNFPEGIATFAGAIKDIKLGVPIAIAIAIHNIPEGIAVSIPIFYATGSKKKAFFYSFLSGLSEPLGAVIGYLILSSFLNDVVLGILFASVAGIMVFISLDELLPTAREYGEHHLSAYGLVVGMIVMAVSLLLLK
jgi:ZIP family zinc transporter